jgi:ABC-type enterobactin transport system permease subunit
VWLAIQMRLTPSRLKRLPDSIVTALAMVGAIGSSTVVGAGTGYLVTVVWFSNTRSDGAAAFVIAAIASGLFASVVVFVAIVCRHHAPSPKAVVVPVGLWLIAATLLTWTICKDSYITAQNALWILKSGDQRSYELHWLIAGWLAILVSLVAALSASRLILRGGHSHSTQPPTTSSLNC